MPRTAVLDHRLTIDGAPVAWLPTRHVGGRIVPTLIVLHDTAGRSTPGQSARYLADNPAQVSAHLVIERDGTITQLAPLDRRTNHAGRSVWRGRPNCNGFAIGIEIVNPGKLAGTPERAVAWFGQAFGGEDGIQAATTAAHGAGCWLPYTEAQISAVEAVVAALARAYPSIEDVAGHHDVSPGRKVDPTPLMPWSRIFDALEAGRGRRRAPDPDAVAAHQQRLNALGYGAGLPDGVAGPRTTGAAAAFQASSGLPVTGRLDAATTAALAASEAPAMPTGAREEVTAADLAATSRTVAAARTQGTVGLATSAAGVALSLATVLGDLGRAFRSLVVEWGPEVVLLTLAAGLVALGWHHRATALRIVGWRVEDVRAGRHIGV